MNEPVRQARKFLVVAMPCCDMAWLSAFLNVGNSICYFDPLGNLVDLEELHEIYRSTSYKYIGIADNGLGFFLDWIKENIGCPIVVLDRDPHDVSNVMLKLGYPATNYPHLAHEELVKHRHDANVLWVPNELLREKRVIQKVFWHVMPGEPFDEVRFKEFARYKIEVELTPQRVEQRAGVFTRLLKDGQISGPLRMMS
jgi:hypothetical protein